MLQKQVLELRDEEGLSFADIGEELEISKSQAYQLYKKATEEKTFINDNPNVQKRLQKTFINDDKNVQKRSKKPFINSMDIPQTADNMEGIIELRQLEMEHEINILDRTIEQDEEKRELKKELKEVKERLEKLEFNYEGMETAHDHLSSEYATLESQYATLKSENEALKEELNEYEEQEINQEEIETETDEYEEQENELIELNENIKNDILELFINVKKYVHNKNNSSIFLGRIENIQIDLEDKYPGIDPSETFEEFNFIIELKEYLEESKQYHSLIYSYRFDNRVPKDLQQKITNYIENN